MTKPKPPELTPEELDQVHQLLTALQEGRSVDAWALAKMPVLQKAWEKMRAMKTEAS